MTRRSLFGAFLAALLAPLARWFGKGDAEPFRLVGHLSEREWLRTFAPGDRVEFVSRDANVSHYIGTINLDVTEAQAAIERLGREMSARGTYRELTDEEVDAITATIKVVGDA